VLLITHQLEMTRLTDLVAVMEAGRVVETWQPGAHARIAAAVAEDPA
jgi:ABC-type dipeptide/oligopeptide/nickel transport system ATPase component